MALYDSFPQVYEMLVPSTEKGALTRSIFFKISPRVKNGDAAHYREHVATVTIANLRKQVGHDANSRAHLCSEEAAARAAASEARGFASQWDDEFFSRRHFATERKGEKRAEQK